MTHITRRDLAMLATAALITRTALAQTNEAPSIIRAIPRTGERIPAVGLGTAYGFDRDDEQTRRAATLVVRTLVESGGQLIDTASTYGDAESVLGTVMASEGFRDKLFIATKLEAPDAAELKRSLSRLKIAKLDLLQLHNVRNRRQSLAQFKAWKAQGVCRYVGVTSTFHGDFRAMEAVIAREQPDFMQIDYSLGDREAQKTHPDDPASGAVFTTEGNLDTQAPTGRQVCAPQAAPLAPPWAGVLNTCPGQALPAHTHHIKKCPAGEEANP